MGFLLLVPFLLIRFGLLALLDKGAVKRAAYFAPLTRREKPAYWLYQLSNAALFLYLCFLQIRPAPAVLLYTGLALYAVGGLLLVGAVAGFARPAKSGLNQNRLYRFSRNPMYVAYFVLFLGCVLLTQSLLLLLFLLAFQTSAHWIIRAEERWCIGRFGEEYLQYRKEVRRYF